MHSKIIQLESHPVDISVRIGPEEYCTDHWFVSSVADYVTDDDSRDDTLETLVNVLNVENGCIEKFSDERGDGILLHENCREVYLRGQYQGFEAALRNLMAKTTVEAFCEDKIGLEMHQLEESYHTKYGYYIQNDDEGLITLMDWVRTARPETKYYFGGTVDYHF